MIRDLLRFPSKLRCALLLALAIAALAAPSALGYAGSRRAADDFPAQLADTGLFADIESQQLAEGVLAYEPQYPLWTDGASKRRWIRIPAGSSIDASDADHFVFPIGTRLWKEFSFGRRIETRMMVLGADKRWRFGTYQWSADQRAAALAPERGVPAACEAAPGLPFDIPGRADCLACHDAGPNAVLGFNALQLSADRDPLAPHAQPLPPGALELGDFVRRGLLRNLPQRFVERPPRIAAATPRERAALGYLSANCGICHTAEGALAGLGLDLSYALMRSGEPAALATALERKSRFRWPCDADPLRISCSQPERSVLVRRMASRQPLAQMPPLGTRLCDRTALDLVTEWIREDLAPASRAGTNPPTLLTKPNH